MGILKNYEKKIWDKKWFFDCDVERRKDAKGSSPGGGKMMSHQSNNKISTITLSRKINSQTKISDKN